MNRKGLIALGVIATIGKIAAALILASMLARCAKDEPIAGRLEGDNMPIGEFDYSLGKSVTQPGNNSNIAPQTHSYGRNRK